MATPTIEEMMEDLREADARGNDRLARVIAERIKAAKNAPVDFSFGEMVSNIPESAARYGKGVASGVEALGKAAMSPIDTGKALMNADWGEVGQGIKDYATERYGSWDRFQSALMQDPVGVLGDVSMLGGVGAIPKLGQAGNVIGKLGYLDPLAAAGGGLGLAAKAASGPVAKTYANAMRLPDDPRRMEIAQTGLENEATLDLASRQRVQQRAQELGREASELLAPHRRKRLGLENVQEELNAVGREMTRRGNPEWEKNLRQINKVERGIYEGDPTAVKLTLDQMQRGKTDIYESISKAYSKGKGDIKPAREQALKAAARGYRRSIEGVVPEVKPINDEIRRLYDLHKYLPKRDPLPPDSLVRAVASKLPGPLTPEGRAKMAIAVHNISKGDMGKAELILGRNSAAIRNAIRISNEIGEE